MNDIEIWKDIEGFEGMYQISNHGRVKSLERFVYCKSKTNPNRIKECIRKTGSDKDGYHIVSLKKSQKTYIRKIHRLVATAFIPNPDHKEEVNHINGDKQDNRIDNLEWATTKENSRHRTRTRLTQPILTDEQMMDIRENAIIANTGKPHKNSLSYFARKYGVCRSTVSDVYYGKKQYQDSKEEDIKQGGV